MNLSICSKQGSVYGKFHPLSLLCASAFVCLTNTYMNIHHELFVRQSIWLFILQHFIRLSRNVCLSWTHAPFRSRWQVLFIFCLCICLWAICQLVCCRSVNNIREFSLLSLQTKITMCMKRWLIELNFRMHFLLATVIT